MRLWLDTRTAPAEFLRAFQAGEPIADFDNDGELTVADFLAFQGAFAVGCP